MLQALLSWISRPVLGLVFVLVATTALAQSHVRTWGSFSAVDTEVFSVPVASVSASALSNLTVVVTQDGRLLTFGHNYGNAGLPPVAPAGMTFKRVSVGGPPVAIRSDGQLVQWTDFTTGTATPPPSLSAGESWLEVGAGAQRSFALRSDGTIQSWGVPNSPVGQAPGLAAGLNYTSISVGFFFASALVSDGTIRVWGPVAAPAPALPAGVAYLKVRAGAHHLVALRTDGVIVAWGDNYWGQTNVAQLPAGMTYVDVESGANHVIARRSDGEWICWGQNLAGQCDIPPDSTRSYVRVFGGQLHSVGLRADGHIEVWGGYDGSRIPPGMSLTEIDVAREFDAVLALRSDREIVTMFHGASSAPQLPVGVHYEACAQGYDFRMGLGSDGLIRAWGENVHGQLNVPALPPSLEYVAMSAGSQTALALRSDGNAVAWGLNSFGQATVPALPAGLSYTAVYSSRLNSLFLRSDGEIVATGHSNLTTVPQLPTGLVYTKAACGYAVAAAIRSDGQLVAWGGTSVAHPPPPLPPGLSYVEVACGELHGIARRSDGAVITWGSPASATEVPLLEPGRSFLMLTAASEVSAGLIGSISSYVPIATGCAGTLPVARLVPGDTPQVGRTMLLRVRNLPANAALLVSGWNQLNPGIPLAGLGLPGCGWHVAMDFVTALSGTGGEALAELPVPYAPELIGVAFFQQALVFDPGANAAALVVSEAMHATVGG